MAVYSYSAEQAGRVVQGTIAADTPRQARDLLRDRGWEVRRVTPAAVKPAGAVLRRRSRHARHAVSLVRELSTLLGVGVPLLEALDTLARQHSGPFLAVLQQIRDRVSAGSSLAEAMRDRPDVFDDVAVSLVEAGEDSGSLDGTLLRLAEFRERSGLLRSKLGTAMIYPAIVLTMAIGSTLLLMTFVVPRILEPLVQEGRPLPLLTRLVKGISDVLVGHGWWILLGVLATGMGVGWLLRQPGVRAWTDRAILRIPILGDLLLKQAVVRICVVMGTLLRGGVVFERAIQIAQRSTGNSAVSGALAAAERQVHAGGDIGAAIEKTGVFPPMVVQVFALGQQSGRLEEMLDRLAADYDAQVSLAAQRLTAALEPLLILLLAVFVLIVVLATLLPILEVGNVLQ